MRFSPALMYPAGVEIVVITMPPIGAQVVAGLEVVSVLFVLDIYAISYQDA